MNTSDDMSDNTSEVVSINGQTAPGSIREHFARMNGRRFSIGHTAMVRCRFYPRPGMAVMDGDNTYTIRESKATPEGFDLVLDLSSKEEK